MMFISMVATIFAFYLNAKVGTLLLWIAVFYILFLQKGTLVVKLLNAVIYSAPFYPFSFWGTHERLSVCTLLVLLLYAYMTVDVYKRGSRVTLRTGLMLFLWICFLILYVVSILNSLDRVEALLNTYQLVILGYTFYIIPAWIKQEKNKVDTEELIKFFATGVCAVATGIYIQFFAYQFAGITLGEVFTYGSRRIFNLYIYAKSVVSMYISLGLTFFYFQLVEKGKINSIVVLGYLFGALVLNNSRTGLASFFICAVVYTIISFKKAVANVRALSILIIFMVAGLYVVQIMLESRTGLTSIADDNGRSDLIFNALKVLPSNFVFGIGGSARDYAMTLMGITVHNFAIAYLVQFGCIGGALIDYMLFSSVWSATGKYRFYALAALVGGMFFANWQNAVFVIPVFVIAAISSANADGGNTK